MDSTDDVSFYQQSPPAASSTPNHDLSNSYNGNSTDYSPASISAGSSSQNNYSQQDSGNFILQPKTLSNDSDPSFHQYSPYLNHSENANFSQTFPNVSNTNFLNHSGNEPYLVILSQPEGEFRFRYASELKHGNSHGNLMANSLNEERRKHPIRVQLIGVQEGTAVIRCSLVTNSSDPIPHVNRLFRHVNDLQNEFPGVEYLDVPVSHQNEWTATFDQFNAFTIIQTKKDDWKSIIRNRLMNNSTVLNQYQRQQLEQEVQRISSRMDAHSVKLKFETFITSMDGSLGPICSPTYSEPIHKEGRNPTGELKILKVDKFSGSCKGGDEVWILVDKVDRKEIKVRFFEEEDCRRIWESYADFSGNDVHHQHCIIFRTPPYKYLQIESNINVYFELYQPTDGSTSNAERFTYHPPSCNWHFMSSGNGIASLSRVIEMEARIEEELNDIVNQLESSTHLPSTDNTEMAVNRGNMNDFSEGSMEVGVIGNLQLEPSVALPLTDDIEMTMIYVDPNNFPSNGETGQDSSTYPLGEEETDGGYREVPTTPIEGNRGFFAFLEMCCSCFR